MELIDKSALVKGIEKIIPGEPYPRTSETLYGAEKYGKREMCFKILDLINTLEVKEVDLEKEIDDYMAKEWEGIEEDKRFYDMIKSNLSDIAKHFYELGLKAQNEGEIVAEEECTCDKMLNRIVGKGLNLICPVYKMNVNNGDKVKVKIIKGE